MLDKITLEVNGEKLDGFQDASVSRSIETLSGLFTFSTTIRETDDRVLQNKLKVQDSVRVFVGDDLVLTGRIEDLTVSYDAGSHNIRVSGRDKTADLIDSSILQQSYSQRDFLKLTRKVLDDNGYSDIKITDNSNSDLTLPNINTITIKEGESIFQFIDRYAKYLRIFVNSDNEGNLVLATEGSRSNGGALISIKNGLNNNILNASLNTISNQRFNIIEAKAQGDNDSFGEISVDQNGLFSDSEVVSPRRKIISIPDVNTASDLQKIAEWESTVRRARGRRYNCKVVGYKIYFNRMLYHQHM